VESAYK